MKKLMSCLFSPCVEPDLATRSRQALSNRAINRAVRKTWKTTTQQRQEQRPPARRDLNRVPSPANIILIQDPEKFYQELAEWAVPPEVPGACQRQIEHDKANYATAHQRILDCVKSNSVNLHLGYLGLKSLPPCIGQLTRIRRFWLMGNRLANLPDSFWQLTNLRTLNLENNKLEHIPDDIMKMTELEIFLLYGNPLGYVPENLADLRNLECITMDRHNAVHPDFNVSGRLFNHPAFNIPVRPD